MPAFLNEIGAKYFTHSKFSFNVMNSLTGYIPLFILVFLSASQLSGQIANSRIELVKTAEDCCYAISYDLDDFAPAYTAFELRLPPGIELSLLNLSFEEGWFLEDLFFANGYRFYLQNGGVLPRSATNILQICLDSSLEGLSETLEFRWYIDGSLLAREYKDVSCAACSIAFQDSVVCNDTAGYTLFLQFVNQSVFDIDHLELEQIAGLTSVEAMLISLEGIVASGDTSEWIPISLNGNAEIDPDICLSLSSSRFVDGLRLDCCSNTFCVELPVCDRCCVDSTAFLADVAAGFDLTYNDLDSLCGSVDLLVTPRQLTACDSTLITRRFLEDEISISLPGNGNEPALFNGVANAGLYEICMEVNRLNFERESCFANSPLTYCDTILIDCMTSVRENNEADVSFAVFPNPASKDIHLQEHFYSQINIATLLTINGQVLKQKQGSGPGGTKLFSIADLSSGVYMLHLQLVDGSHHFQKIIKQ